MRGRGKIRTTLVMARVVRTKMGVVLAMSSEMSGCFDTADTTRVLDLKMRRDRLETRLDVRSFED